MATEIFWACLAIAAFFGALIFLLTGAKKKWEIFGAVISVITLMVSVAGILIQHSDSTHANIPSAGQPSRNSKAAGIPNAEHANPLPSSEVTTFPADSPSRKKILDMDEVCGSLGISQHAWLPGQSSALNIADRVILAPGTAYSWSCQHNGPKLTRAQITHGCQIWYPGTGAFTWDPNNAYSWVCI